MEDINRLKKENYQESFQKLVDLNKKIDEEAEKIYNYRQTQIDQLAREVDELEERANWLLKDSAELKTLLKDSSEIKKRFKSEYDEKMSALEKRFNNTINMIRMVSGITLVSKDASNSIGVEIINDSYTETIDRSTLRISYLITFDSIQNEADIIRPHQRVSVTISHNFMNAPEIIAPLLPESFSCSITELQAYFSAVSYTIHNITRQSSSTYEQSMLSEQTFNDSLFAH